MATLLAFLFLSVLFSFICSVLEAVLLSVTPTFINLEKKNNKKYAAKLEALKNDIDMPLIAILTFNTLAHTVGAIGVGASAEQAFGNGSHIVALVSSITTILILVVSEIIPKINWSNLLEAIGRHKYNLPSNYNISFKMDRDYLVVTSYY